MTKEEIMIWIRICTEKAEAYKEQSDLYKKMEGKARDALQRYKAQLMEFEDGEE